MWPDCLWFLQAGNSYCFWSSAAWPPTSCAELFQLYALVLCTCGELLMHFAKLNKPPPSLLSLPSLLRPPSKVLDKNKPFPANRGFMVSLLGNIFLNERKAKTIIRVWTVKMTFDNSQIFVTSTTSKELTAMDLSSSRVAIILSRDGPDG